MATTKPFRSTSSHTGKGNETKGLLQRTWLSVLMYKGRGIFKLVANCTPSARLKIFLIMVHVNKSQLCPPPQYHSTQQESPMLNRAIRYCWSEYVNGRRKERKCSGEACDAEVSSTY
jgi:hypothetical protein